MIFKCFRIVLIIIPFIFLSGFLPIISLLGPGFTVVSSGNVYKAGAQILIDRTIKQKTGKDSLTFVKEEVSKQGNKKDLNQELKQIIEKRIKVVRKTLAMNETKKVLDNNLKQLVEKRIKMVQKKLVTKKISQ